APLNGAAGLVWVACGAEIAAALSVNPTRPIPSFRLLLPPFSIPSLSLLFQSPSKRADWSEPLYTVLLVCAPLNGAAGLVWVACGAEIAAALSGTFTRHTFFPPLLPPSLSHPSPSSCRALPNGAAGLVWVACGAEIAAALSVTFTRPPFFPPLLPPSLSHPSPSSVRAPLNGAAGLVWVACGAEIAAALSVNPTRPIPSFRRSSPPSLSRPSPSSCRALPNGASGRVCGMRRSV
ncbi:unnamed protein product, partial [Closterium sp. Naga37s-1]